MKLKGLILAMVMLSAKLICAAQVCGVSTLNSIRLYSEDGQQLIGTNWVAQLYYGFPGENERQFRALPLPGHAREFSIGPIRSYTFADTNYPFLQFQMRFWNREVALSWEEAVRAAECDQNVLTGASKTLQLNPWTTHCDCGITICLNFTFAQLGEDSTIILHPLPPAIRLRYARTLEGIQIRLCNSPAVPLAIEQSEDLSKWSIPPKIVVISENEFLIPEDPAFRTRFFRVRGIPEVTGFKR